jgi:hypothetical protein
MSKKLKSGRKSKKGTWGHVGAPPKETKWPNNPFTMKQLFAKNKGKQCELSLRNKVNDGVADGTLVELLPKKQPNKSVGRPKSVFVLKEFFNASEHTKADKKTVRVKKVRVSTVTVSPSAPAVAPIVSPEPPVATPVPATSVPATLAAPAETPAPVVESAPVAPVASEPVVG